MLKHVELLNKHGISAFALCDKNFKPWVATKANIIRNGPEGWPCPKNSILVMPETVDRKFVDLFNGREDVARVILCQSYRGVGVRDGAILNAEKFRIRSIIANYNLVANVISQRTIFHDTPIVPCWVDTNIYSPGVKKSIIAYMPNKLPAAKEKISTYLRQRAHDFEWKEIQGQTQIETARILAEAAIFLNLGYREGFGLPPLEAMSAGCLVVGFHAEGAKAYASAANGMWHDEDDYLGCASSLDRAIDIYSDQSTAYNDYISNGMQTARRYNIANTEQSLLKTFVNIIIQNGLLIRDYIETQ